MRVALPVLFIAIAVMLSGCGIVPVRIIYVEGTPIQQSAGYLYSPAPYVLNGALSPSLYMYMQLPPLVYYYPPRVMSPSNWIFYYGR